MGAIIRAEGQGAILWVFGSGLTAASMLGVVVSIPTIAVPSLHSVRRCSRVSCLSQCLQRLEAANRILCNRSFVGIMSCMTLYLIDLVSSGTGVACRFFHTDYQSVDGQSWAMHITWGPVCTCNRVLMVSYTLLLYDLGDSLRPGGSTYAVSSAKRRR